jgi:hypothetical protein
MPRSSTKAPTRPVARPSPSSSAVFPPSLPSHIDLHPSISTRPSKRRLLEQNSLVQDELEGFDQPVAAAEQESSFLSSLTPSPPKRKENEDAVEGIEGTPLKRRKRKIEQDATPVATQEAETEDARSAFVTSSEAAAETGTVEATAQSDVEPDTQE